MIANQDIAWSGPTPGRARAGEEVDETRIPAAILARWQRPTFTCAVCGYRTQDAAAARTGHSVRTAEGMQACTGKMAEQAPVLGARRGVNLEVSV